MNKKFEFDLVMSDPGEALSRIIKEAGYTPRVVATNPNGDCTIITEEIAKSKGDVFEFLHKVNKVANIDLFVYRIIDTDDREFNYRTTDNRFSGLIYFDGIVDNARFMLEYSSKGILW